MQIRILGCSGSIAAGCRTTAFLLDQDVLIDAGTGVGALALEEMARIDHILISHSHLDHVLAIGLLADSVIRSRVGQPPIQVHALPQTIDALRKHIFNGVIWPDFTRLPSAEAPVLQLVPFEIGQIITLGERRIEVLPAAHTVPAAVSQCWARRSPSAARSSTPAIRARTLSCGPACTA
jgi:glyoxylase-like metal-dependent hydrolase (beta-lactamase superfamily II)